MEKSMDLSILDGCPLFYELYDKEIVKVVKNADVFAFEDETVILEDGSEGEEIFVVLEGEVDLLKRGADGKMHRIVTLSKGAVFGEMVLIDEKVRAASIVSRGMSFILEIKFQKILNLYNHEPKIFGVIMLNIARLITRRLRMANSLVNKLKKEAA